MIPNSVKHPVFIPLAPLSPFLPLVLQFAAVSVTKVTTLRPTSESPGIARVGYRIVSSSTWKLFPVFSYSRRIYLMTDYDQRHDSESQSPLHGYFDILKLINNFHRG